MNNFISSPANFRIHNIKKLQSGSHERAEQKRFVIEGFREIGRALDAGFRITELYVCPAIDKQGRGDEILRRVSGILMFNISEAAFQRIAYRETSDGLIAIAEARYLSLDNLRLSQNPFMLILQSVEKPGNLGAILRTADAVGLDAVIVCDPLSDLYNPNVIRSSVGCVFTRQVVECSSQEAIEWLKKMNIRIFAAALSNDAEIYYNLDYRIPCAFVMGTEATGLSTGWLEKSDKQVIIPMQGIADSLNVSTSAAILVFEAARQRGKAKG